MNHKGAVLSRFPEAWCEVEIPLLLGLAPSYYILDVPRGKYPDRSIGVWGYGATESEAWEDARWRIERHEGRRLPLKA